MDTSLARLQGPIFPLSCRPGIKPLIDASMTMRLMLGPQVLHICTICSSYIRREVKVRYAYTEGKGGRAYLFELYSFEGSRMSGELVKREEGFPA